MIKKIFLILILLIPLATAAEIRGTIYDTSLKEVNNAIVEVNSTPVQRIVAKDGKYSFNLPPGGYILTATHKDESAEEEITIESEGIFNIDIFLFPAFAEEQELLEEDININQLEPEKNIFPIVLIVLAIIAIIFYLSYKFKVIKKRFKEVKKEEIIDSDLEKVIEIIKNHGNRTTQKEIRKELNLSEAKVSLIITELEAKQKVEKIKKGRANVIILKQH